MGCALPNIIRISSPERRSVHKHPTPLAPLTLLNHGNHCYCVLRGCILKVKKKLNIRVTLCVLCKLFAEAEERIEHLACGTVND